MFSSLRVSATLALALLCALPLWAETTAETEPEADVVMLVTDTMIAHPISESIASATVITAEELREIGAQTAADAMRLVPGVTLRQTGQFGGSTSSSLRGTKPNQVLVLIDGQRVTSQAFIGGVDLSKFPIEQIARIEVIRGPVSSLYGSEAFGGVINIITKQPTTSGGDAILATGAEGRAERSLTVRSANDPVQWQLSAAFPEFDGERVNSAFTASNLTGRVILPELHGWEFSLRGEGYQDSQGVPGPVYDPSTTNHQWFDRVNFELLGQREIAEGNLNWRAYTINQQLRNENPAWFTDSRISGLTSATELTYARELDNHQWVVGGEYRNESYQDVEGGFTPSNTKHANSNRALFAQDTIKLDGLTSVVLGARLDNHSTAGSKVAPRVGVNRQIIPGLNTRASYAVGFRAPNFVELYYDNFGTVGNPNLKPETSGQLEVGMNYARGNTAIDLAVFNTDVRDQIIWTPVSGIPDVTSTYENINRARQRGIELSTEQKIARVVTLGLSYSYTDSQNRTTGERLNGIPHNKITLFAAGAVRNWDVNLSGRWTDDRPDSVYDPLTWASSPVMVPGRAVLDLTVMSKNSGAVQPYFVLRNLTNASYEEVAGFPAEGRSLEVGLRSKW